VLNGDVWYPEVVAKHTTRRTDVVCHHGAGPSTIGWFKTKLQPADVFSRQAVNGFAKGGVKEVISVTYM
jgi:hypothetical protein